MKFGLKYYKYYKLKRLIKNNDFIFIFNSLNSSYKNWSKVEQRLHNSNIKYYKVNNNLCFKILDKSILKNLSCLLNGPFLFLFFINYEDKNQELIKSLKMFNLQIFAIKLKKKIYYNNHFDLLSSYKFIKNIKVFNKSIYHIIKRNLLINFFLLYDK